MPRLRIATSLALIALLATTWPLASAAKPARHSHGHTAAPAPVDAVAAAAKLNESTSDATLKPGTHGTTVARAQTLLDRAWFTPGEIDGSFSTNMRHAVTAFQSAKGLAATGVIDSATWQALGAGETPAFTTYTITEADAAGPFTKTPADIMDRAKLKSLDYQTLAEAIAERFHMSQALLQKLNPGRPLAAGQEIVVANTQDATGAVALHAASGASSAPRAASSASATPRAASIQIDKSERVLYLLDTQARVVAAFPVSLGGPLDPLPVGKMKITNAVENPLFTYDPALIKSAKASDAKVDIQPGPNNPVGNMWLGLTKPHWGIHGTPEPSRLGREETNGCVHLTNWDAHRVASVTKAGTVVDVRP